MRPLGVLAAALVLAAPGGALPARELRVTSGQDGAPGSLRRLVEDVARAGDTIVFPTALRVQLGRKLTIPKELAGLTIDGGTPTGGRAELVGAAGAFLQVDADRVTLRRLRLTGLPVVFESRAAGGAEVGVAGARVLGVEAAGPTRGRHGIELSHARGFVVEGGRIANGLDLVGTLGGTIRGVTFAAKGSALSDMTSEGLQLTRNTFESGRVALRSLGVRVTGNDVRAAATLDVWIHAGGTGSVTGNDVAGRILAQAGGSVEVVRNTVTGTWSGGAGLPGITVGCATDGARPRVSARRNAVSGRRVGISVQCGRAVRIALEGNVVERNGDGIVVAAREAAISAGAVRANRGTGIAVRRDSRTTIRKVRFGGNGRLGIDRRDGAVRPPVLRYDAEAELLRGRACPGCAVDVYVAEEGREPGEGLRRLGTVRAGADGTFAYPPGGTLKCPSPLPLTALATDVRRRITSEFARDALCAAEAEPDCAARFSPVAHAPGTVGASGGRVEARCAGVDVKSVSVSAGSGGQRIATFASAGSCRKEPSSGVPDRVLRCLFAAGNRGRVVAFDYTTNEPFASTTVHVLAGGSGSTGTEIVLRQTYFFTREGVTCSQTVPAAPGQRCASL